MDVDFFELKSKLAKISAAKISDHCKNKTNVLILTHNPEIFNSENPNLKILEFDDNTLNKIKNSNFNYIVLDQILEGLLDPKMFLQILSKNLISDGMLFINSYNFLNIFNRIKILDGDFNYQKFNAEKILNIFSLTDILLLLSETKFSSVGFERIFPEINLMNQSIVKNYVISEHLWNSICSDPDSQTFFYLIRAKPNPNVHHLSRKWAYQFEKNIVSQNLNPSSIPFTKEVAYLKQVNQEQYDKIKLLDRELHEKDHYEKLLKKIIEDKDAQLDEFRNSFLFKLLNKFR